jgi:hypothetical protein
VAHVAPGGKTVSVSGITAFFARHKGAGGLVNVGTALAVMPAPMSTSIVQLPSFNVAVFIDVNVGCAA